MKILICGVPAGQVTRVLQKVRHAEVTCLTDQDSDQLWRQMVRPADLCIIIPRYMAHKWFVLVKGVFGRNYVNASSLKHAITIAYTASTEHTQLIEGIAA
jgi:hypothetical protein